MKKTIKQYVYDFATKKLTEVTQAPSFIPADVQKQVIAAVEQSKEKQLFVYFWKKNERMMGVCLTGKEVPTDILPSVIEDAESRHRSSSITTDLLSVLLELELVSSLAGLLQEFEPDCATCKSITCRKSPMYKK